jgi:XTP/dITP diphosphohydrolase
MSSPVQRRLLLASGNRGKVDELQRFLEDLPIQVLSPLEAGIVLPAVEEDGLTFRENAEKKALSAAAFCEPGLQVLADDSGLEVDALDGAPGVRSARFSGSTGTHAQRDEANNRHLLHLMAGISNRRRTARFVCVLAVAAAGQVVVTATGQVNGVILAEPRGEGGFGYDSLFLYPPTGQTFAQMTPAEKLSVSHRGRALAALRDALSR